MIATLIERRDIAENIYSFDFAITEPINHSAGQYVNLILPHDNVDSRGKERWFSVSSAPGEKSFQITTKFIPEKSSSFKKALFELMPGDSLTVSSPMGDFVMPIDKKRQLLFVAAGIGITPYLSMFKQMAEHPEGRYIVFYYALSSMREAVDVKRFIPLLKEMKYFDSEKGDRISSKIIYDRAKSMDNPLIYLAGPEQMTEIFRDQLVEMGIKREDIVGDYFDGY